MDDNDKCGSSEAAEPADGSEQITGAAAETQTSRRQDASNTSGVERSVDDEQLKRLLVDEAMRLPDLGIAITGIAGRFPKSDSVNEYEQHLYEGVDMVADEDSSRFECRLWGLPPRYGRLKSLAEFDCEFFGYAPDDARNLDYQLRILFEVVYESILDAGVNPASLRGTNTGVFFGHHTNEFENSAHEQPDFKAHGYYAQFAVKIAQYFDLRGVTCTFDTACASGFTAFQQGVEAVRLGICDQVIVCSSNITVHPANGYIFLQMQMLSPTGYSRFLDARADGYVKAEACVSLFVQQKDVAKRNYASIMASLTSADGWKREGITWPSVTGQEWLVRATKRAAGISTNHVEYIEAHGTGTPAGDPQESCALTRVYCPRMKSASCDAEQQQAPKSDENKIKIGDDGFVDEAEYEQRVIGPLLVCSSKTNMGHAEAVSGLCALTKVALQFEHEILYAGLHHERRNTNIKPLVDGRLEFVGERRPMVGKITPLSCYGFGGANVHVIARASERPAISASPTSDDLQPTRENPRLVVMFGRSPEAVEAFFDAILDSESRHTRHCLSDDFLSLVDAINASRIDRMMEARGYLLVDRRQLGPSRVIARDVKVCKSSTTPRQQQQQQQQQQQLQHSAHKHIQEAAERPINLIFPGLGCHWPAMAAGLHQYAPFWSTIERLAEFVKPRGVDLVRALCEQDPGEECKSLCTIITSIIAYQIALVNMIKKQLKLDLKARYKIVGHSIGEISCAYAAGLLDERETILVAYHVGRMLDVHLGSIGGSMVALGASEAECERRIAVYKSLRVCCVNGPESCTVSGARDEIDALICELEKDAGMFVRRVPDSLAVHNELSMDASVRQALRDAIVTVIFPGTKIERPTRTWISTVAGDSSKLLDAEYFARNICTKVDFYAATQQLDDDSIVLELAPSAVFASQFALMSEPKVHYASMMRRDTPADKQLSMLLESFGKLYQLGASFDLTHFHLGAERASQMYPVRRQTPSLSSLVKWRRDHEMFVPRYPKQFGRSSAKCHFLVNIIEERSKYLTGHCVEGRILQPATGYLYFVWRVFSYTRKNVPDLCFQEVEQELLPVEFYNVRLLRAIMLQGGTQADVYVHYEEATGKFAVREGGSVVVEGYVFSPKEAPVDGLLYEDVRKRLAAEQMDLPLSREDIYKEFRLCGYDYGETFQSIDASSADGRYCRVKFNGHFVALTDAILQSYFMAATRYSATGGLYLPTKFEYVRFIPEVLVAKMSAAGMEFDKTFRLDNKQRREIMFKLTEQDSGNLPGDAAPVATKAGDAEDGKAEDAKEEPEKPAPECIFDTYCDPITGIAITDGIEFRGVKVTPYPRRVDESDVLLESYQFVADIETPVVDENLSRFDSLVKPYIDACNASASLVSRKLFSSDGQPIGDDEPFLEQYKSDYLDCTRKTHTLEQEPNQTQATATVLPPTDKNNNENIQRKLLGAPVIDADDTQIETREAQIYDIKQNGDRTLLSVLDQLEYVDTVDEARQILEKNKTHLLRDLTQRSFACERVLRSLAEIAVENLCAGKLNMSVLEVNRDDVLMREPLLRIIKFIEPSLVPNYSLAHPNFERLSAQKLSPAASEQVKTFTLRNFAGLFADNNLKELDLILYRDLSCCIAAPIVCNAATPIAQSDTNEEEDGSAPAMEHVQTSDDPASIVKSFVGGGRAGGFVLLAMRESLTPAELLIMKLAQNVPETATLKDVNANYRLRCQQFEQEALNANWTLVAKKGDSNGCLLSLYKTGDEPNDIRRQSDETQQETRPTIIQVEHGDVQRVQSWLEKLKQLTKRPEQAKTETDEPKVEGDTKAPESDVQAVQETKEPDNNEQQEDEWRPPKVWLCAVATKDKPINGLLGFMQVLRREIGSAHLRCYYDMHTFQDRLSPITDDEIESSPQFQLALRRDVLWHCIDKLGRVGSYRHFTVNEYMSYSDCLCDKQPIRKRNINANSVENEVIYANNAKKGDLSTFTWFEAPYKYLSDEQRASLVQVHYSALNFRDIMLATGRLPLDVLPARTATNECQLGLEFSGVDSKGKRVMGIVPNCGIATHVLCERSSSILIEVPDTMSLREAATIPVVYATVIMALMLRGRARPKESVLIHAGSGGVGQAAIRLALHMQLRVFTTVGSAEKRKFLLQEFASSGLREDHIFNSRDCNFEHEIYRSTQGRGVDMVLNSLAEDKLQASIRCLADGGRFLEIGKYDLAMDSRLELLLLDTNKTFHGIHLDKLFDVDAAQEATFKAQIERVRKTLVDGLEQGYVRPIKSTVFARNQTEQAFRYMATGKHVGKVLIEMRDETSEQQSLLSSPVQQAVPRFHFSPQKSYIITGGLGGFGLELAKWLVASQGVRHLVLTSRGGFKNEYQRWSLKRLERLTGARVQIVDQTQADACTREGARELLRIARELAPSRNIGGLFHLAMVLKDSLLENSNAEDFETVCRPKIDQCELLDEAERELTNDEDKMQPLDCFVVFSSVACGKGNPGQSNYAYANSAIERIMERRREEGRAALAVQWGAIGDVGVAYDTLGGNDAIIGGTRPQRMPSCFATLAKLLAGPFVTCLSVVPVNRNSAMCGAKTDLVAAVFHVLGIKDPSKVSDSATLGELGLDSLMAVEIRQHIEREYDMILNIQEIRALTIARIRDISENGPPNAAARRTAATAANAAAAAQAKTDSAAAAAAAAQEPAIGKN